MKNGQFWQSSGFMAIVVISAFASRITVNGIFPDGHADTVPVRSSIAKSSIDSGSDSGVESDTDPGSSPFAPATGLTNSTPISAASCTFSSEP